MKHQTPDVAARIRRIVAKRGLDVVDSDEVPQAFANEGRWVAKCPCNGAEVVTPGKPMVCGSCGRRFARVEFPDGWEQAERLLDLRPHRENRNWFPDRESVADLRAENVEHGVEAD